MIYHKLGEVELKFVEIIWQNEPLPSGELVKLCKKELEWKKSTTYTVIRKLRDKGIIQSKDGVVSALITKKQYFTMQSEMFVKETFAGSLPQFLTAFASEKKLSESEIAEIQRIIDEQQEV